MGFWSPVTAGSGRLELEQKRRRVVVGLSEVIRGRWRGPLGSWMILRV